MANNTATENVHHLTFPLSADYPQCRQRVLLELRIIPLAFPAPESPHELLCGRRELQERFTRLRAYSASNQTDGSCMGNMQTRSNESNALP